MEVQLKKLHLSKVYDMPMYITCEMTTSHNQGHTHHLTEFSFVCGGGGWEGLKSTFLADSKNTEQ